MKLPLGPATWLFATCVVYFVAGMINLFVYAFAPTELIQMAWLCITALPLFVPMRKVVDIDTVWSM